MTAGVNGRVPAAKRTSPAAKRTSPAAKKATGKPTAKPTDDVLFDLDALEKEAGRPEPFAFRHNGRDFTLNDPQDIDWRDLMTALSEPIGFVRYVMNSEDHKAFMAMTTPEWKMRALVQAYFAHWGIDLGEAGGSSAF